MLREAEILLSQGTTIGEASDKIRVTEQTYYCWRREYGGMRVDQARRLNELEKGNTRLKRLVADLSLDISILKEAYKGRLLSQSKRRKAVTGVREALAVSVRDGHGRCWDNAEQQAVQSACAASVRMGLYPSI